MGQRVPVCFGSLKTKAIRATIIGNIAQIMNTKLVVRKGEGGLSWYLFGE